MVLSNREINDPTLHKRKENAGDCTTNIWQGPSRNIEPFLSKPTRRTNSSKELKNTTMRSTLEQAGGSINSSRETCRFRRHRPRPRIGKATIGRQEVGIPGILDGLTIRGHFLSDWTSFGWPGDKLPDNRREVWTEHTLARHIRARTAHRRTHRTDVPLTQHAWLKSFCHGVSKRSLSSQRHVPHVAALATKHLYTISLTNFTSLTCPT